MSDHVSSCTDRLVTSDHLNSEGASSGESSRAQGTTSLSTTKPEEVEEESHVNDEEEPLIQSVECRICQEEDSVKNLESPCSCSGSLKVSSSSVFVSTFLPEN